MTTESEDPRVVALEAVQEELRLLRGDVRSTRLSVKDRIKTYRRLLYGFAALSLVAGFSAFQSRQAVNDVRTVIAQQETDRKDRSQGSCLQFNVNQQNQRAAIADGVVEGLRPLITTVEGEAFIEGFSTSLHSSVNAKLPYRDCSPAGIEKFLRDPPADPATKPGG